MSSNIKVEGLDKLQQALKENVTLDDVRRVVRQNGAEMTEKMVKNAEFNKGYQTGQTKRSINMQILDDGMTAEAAPTTEYSPYLEYGTRYMDAQPFVKPSYNEQIGQFKKDMQKLVR